MAARYWVGGGSSTNWNATANTNWSATSGGAGNASVPTSADDVNFDLNSNSTAVVITSGATCKTLTVTVGYTQNFTMNNVLTVAGSATLGVNMTFTGSAGLTISTTSTLTSNGVTFPNTLTFSGVSTYTIADSWTVGGLTISANSTANTNPINVTGSFTCTGSLAGSSTINLTGTGTWSGSGNMTVTAFTINTAGTITMSGSLAIGGACIVTYTAGTVTQSTSSVAFGNTVTINSSGMTWHNASFNTGTYTLSSAMTLDGTVTTVATNLGTIVNGFSMTCAGLNLNSMTSGSLSGTTTFTLTGGTFSMTGITSGSMSNSLEFAGNVTVSGAISYKTGVFKHTSGTITASGSTVNFIAATTFTVNTTPSTWNAFTLVGNQTFNGSQGWTMASLTAVTAGNTFTFTSGNTYAVTSACIIAGTKTSAITMLSSSGGSTFSFNLSNGATYEIARVTATDINSSGGQTIFDFGTNTLSNTTNWVAWLAPATVGSASA